MADRLSPAVAEPRANPPSFERRKAYCRELTRLIVHYAGPAEVEQLAEVLEVTARDITHGRPCQGLHDASYDAFVRYVLA